jgi:nucleoside-diphosphate-sugar epimerase
MSNPTTISITGATGFIGAHLVRHFSQLGYSVEATGRQKIPPIQLLQFASYLQADIAHYVPDLKGDIVIHTAALASDTASWEDLYETNVEGTKRVYEAAKNCRLFIHISSASVYPFQEKPLSETDVKQELILSNYGKSKYLSEEVLKQNQQDSNVVILRPRAVYGTGDRILLPRILKLVKMQSIIAPSALDIQDSMPHIDR